jgi:hypothetical protein
LGEGGGKMRTIKELNKVIEGFDENTEISIEVRDSHGDYYDCSIDSWNYLKSLNELCLVIAIPEADKND